MTMKELYKYTALIKEEETNREIASGTVKSSVSGEDIVTLGCDPSKFENIKKVLVVFHNADEAVLYHGTVRRLMYANNEVVIALYKKEDYNNREQQRFSLMAEVSILRYIKDGVLIEPAQPIMGRLLDISAHGARIQVAEDILGINDFLAFRLKENAIKKMLRGEVMRIANQEEGNYQYGILLLGDNDKENERRRKKYEKRREQIEASQVKKQVPPLPVSSQSESQQPVVPAQSQMVSPTVAEPDDNHIPTQGIGGKPISQMMTGEVPIPPMPQKVIENPLTPKPMESKDMELGDVELKN